MAAVLLLVDGGPHPVRLSTKLPAAMQHGHDASDEIVRLAKEAARSLIGKDLEHVRAALAGADPTLHELRAALVRAYGRMQPRRLAALTYRALVLAELSGRLAAAEQAQLAPTG